MIINTLNRIKRYYTYFKSSFSYPEKINFGKFTFKFKNSKLSPGIKYYLSKNISNYEFGERKLVEELLIKGDVVIEAGTSLGILSGLISNLVGEDGKLITLEGDAKLSKIAMSINSDNKNIYFISGALTFDDAPFVYFDKDGWLGGKIAKGRNSVKVKAFNLIKLCQEYTPSTLVIDIEGGETGFFNIVIPNSINKIIIELHPSIYGKDLEFKLIEYFKSQNFNFHRNVESVSSFIRKV
jgi:hypothetical protein